MSLSLSRKAKLITKWTDTTVSGISDPSTFSSSTYTEVYTNTSDLPNFSPNYTTIERNVVKDSFYDDAAIRGYAEISANLAFELGGSGAANTKPLYHPFLYATFGSLSTVQTTADSSDPAASFSASGNYYTGSFKVADVTGFKVGMFVRVYSSTTTRLVGEITAIDSSAKTLSLRMHTNMIASTSSSTLGITASDSITTGCIYQPSDSLDLPSLYFDLYRQLAGQTKYVKETNCDFTNNIFIIILNY